jgi:hypothetical protein
LPRIATPQSEHGEEDDNSDDESQYMSTLSEERRDDIMIDDSSEKSSNDNSNFNGNSNLDSKSNQGDTWARHVIRPGHKTGLQSGWLDVSTEGNMQSTPVAMTAIQNYYGLSLGSASPKCTKQVSFCLLNT